MEEEQTNQINSEQNKESENTAAESPTNENDAHDHEEESPKTPTQNPETTETSQDPRIRNGFSPIEDAMITWFFFCEQITNTTKLQQLIMDKPLPMIAKRFIEILNTPELLENVKKTLKDDIFGFKPASFSPLEEFYLLRGLEIHKTKKPEDVYSRYPFLFHPSRTVASLNSCEEKLKKRQITSSEIALQGIQDLMEEVREKIENVPLLPFPGDYDNPVEEVRKVMDQDSFEEEEEDYISVGEIIQESEKRMTSKIYAVLIGQSAIYPIYKIKTVIGRKSPKSNADIDIDANLSETLSKVSRHHIDLIFSTDLRFYAKVVGKFILVNGQMFSQGAYVLLKDLDVLDVGGRVLIFHENRELFNRLRAVSNH